MKLPRWLVIGMWTASGLAVLAAAGWWWNTWPERTARVFDDLLHDGRFKEARIMIIEDSDGLYDPYDLHYWPPPKYSEAQWKKGEFQPLSRTWADVVCGRQQIELSIPYVVTIVRGRVVHGGLLLPDETEETVTNSPASNR